MSKLLMLCLIFGLGFPAFSQGQPENDKAMERRAADMHKAILSGEKSDWVKFVVENYSPALIDKPMVARIEKDGESSTTPSGGRTMEEKVNAKAMMFSRLHDDFGSSKVKSLKTSVNQVAMTLEGDDGTAIVTLKFDASKPWLISGIGVEARQ